MYCGLILIVVRLVVMLSFHVNAYKIEEIVRSVTRLVLPSIRYVCWIQYKKADDKWFA